MPSRRMPSPPVDAAVELGIGDVERAIVELDDHVQAGGDEVVHDCLAGKVQRRRRRPGRRVQRRRTRWIEAQAGADPSRIVLAVHQRIDFRIADEHRGVARDDAAVEIAAHPIGIDEGDAVELAESGWQPPG